MLHVHVMVHVPAVHLLLKKLESLGHHPSVAVWEAFPCWCTITHMSTWLRPCGKYSFAGLWLLQSILHQKLISCWLIVTSKWLSNCGCLKGTHNTSECCSSDTFYKGFYLLLCITRKYALCKNIYLPLISRQYCDDLVIHS